MAQSLRVLSAEGGGIWGWGWSEQHGRGHWPGCRMHDGGASDSVDRDTHQIGIASVELYFNCSGNDESRWRIDLGGD